MMKQFAFVNLSKYLTNENVELIRRAVNVQMARDVTEAWHLSPRPVTVYPRLKDVPVGSIRHYFLDDPDQADLLGYHSVDPDGNAYIKTFVKPILDAGGTILHGSLSVSVTASHECCETAVDESSSMFATIPDGTILPDGRTALHELIAYEVCDPVEGTSYEVPLVNAPVVSVSNFVFPGYFVEGYKGQCDFCNLVKEPFGILPESYIILLGNDGIYSNVFSRSTFPSWKVDLKTHAASRRSQRRKPNWK